MATSRKISVIIPILNEAKILDKTLSQLHPELGHHELIIVDGGSSDDSVCIAEKYGKVIASARGRAKQLNAGQRRQRVISYFSYMQMSGSSWAHWRQ